MVDIERKKAILDAEREFERRENLSRDLANKGVTLIGTITSPAPPSDPAGPERGEDDLPSPPLGP